MDVQGVSAKIAHLMSIENNISDFRIYKMVDGGASWAIEFENQTDNAFYDCLAFWTPRRGFAHNERAELGPCSSVACSIRPRKGCTPMSK